MKIMIVNSKTKQKPKTILERIRNLVLDFIIYFVTAYIIMFDLKKYRGVIFHDSEG